jgi:DNA-directed RNA polymerase beta subunit
MAQSANAFTHSFTSRKRIRKNFGTMLSATSLPNLIEVQKNSYEQFLQIVCAGENRTQHRPAGRVQIGIPD